MEIKRAKELLEKELSLESIDGGGLDEALTTLIDLAKSYQECRGLPDMFDINKICLEYSTSKTSEYAVAVVCVQKILDLCQIPFAKRLEEIKEKDKEIKKLRERLSIWNIDKLTKELQTLKARCEELFKNNNEIRIAYNSLQSGKDKEITKLKAQRLTREEFHYIMCEFTPSIARDSGQPEWTSGELNRVYNYLIGKRMYLITEDLQKKEITKLKDMIKHAKGCKFCGKIDVENVKLKKENKVLNLWVRDLQAGMYINCVYCGHRYGPREDTPVSMAEVLKKHIEKCPKHPMSKLKAKCEGLFKDNNEIRIAYNNLQAEKDKEITSLQNKIIEGTGVISNLEKEIKELKEKIAKLT